MSTGAKSICAICFGLAIGVVSGLGYFIMGLISMGHTATLVTMMGELYIGYKPTFVGSLIGGFWGFLDGFIMGFLIAWFYNLLCKSCKCKICSSCASDNKE